MAELERHYVYSLICVDMLHSPVSYIITLLFYPLHTAAVRIFNFDNSNCHSDDFFF